MLASFKQRERNGFGQSTLLAKALGVNNTYVSQVLKGNKPLNSEHGLKTAQFLNLNEIETEYFLNLVEIDRAGDKNYRDYLDKRLRAIAGKASELVNRLQADSSISEEQRAIYYSDWVYSAVRLCVFIENFDTPEAIAEQLKLPIQRVKEVIEFLVSSNLLIQKSGKLSAGIGNTHLDAKSPWVKAHHSNWRKKGLEEMSFNDENSLHYTVPMTLSAQDVKKVREILVQASKAVDDILVPSKSEELHCLTIDWFKIGY